MTCKVANIVATSCAVLRELTLSVAFWGTQCAGSNVTVAHYFDFDFDFEI